MANTSYWYAPTSVPTSFATVLPSVPGTLHQVLAISAVDDATHIETGWLTVGSGGCVDCVLTDPVSDQTITGSSRFIIDNSSTVTPQASVEFMGLGSGTLGGAPVIVDISGENRTPWYLTMRDKTSSSGSFLGFFSNGSSDVWGIGIIDSAGSPVSDVLFGADGGIYFEQSLAKNIDFIGQSGTVSFTANANYFCYRQYPRHWSFRCDTTTNRIFRNFGGHASIATHGYFGQPSSLHRR